MTQQPHSQTGWFPHTTSDNRCEGAVFPAGGPTIQGSSDANSLGLAQAPGSRAQICPHFDANDEPQATYTSDKMALEIGVPTKTSSSWIIYWSSSQNSGKSYIHVYWFVIKDTAEAQPNERDTQVKAWGGTQPHHPLCASRCPATWEISELHCWGFL